MTRSAMDNDPERDLEREPTLGRKPPDLLPIIERRRQSRLAIDTTIIKLDCPLCKERVFACADSHGESLDCIECETKLITQRAIDGSVSVVER